MGIRLSERAESTDCRLGMSLHYGGNVQVWHPLVDVHLYSTPINIKVEDIH